VDALQNGATLPSVIDDFDVQHRDCFDSLAAMRDAGGVDLIVTSPPYPDARKVEAYGAEFDTSLAGYHKLGRAVFEALKPGGVCALNIDGPIRVWRPEIGESERSLIAFEVALDWARDLGFRYVERCVYRRNGVPISEGPRWRQAVELIHVFSRPGAPPYFDRHGSTRAAKYAGTTFGGRTRDVNGVRTVPRGTVADRRCLNTAERHLTHDSDGEHEAPFASTLADDYVLCYSPPGGIVGDPFVGSGTVAYSCHRHGRRFIGGDLGIRQRDGRRWADIVNDGLRQGRLFADLEASA
jgi:DNA modification methylase